MSVSVSHHAAQAGSARIRWQMICSAWSRAQGSQVCGRCSSCLGMVFPLRSWRLLARYSGVSATALRFAAIAAADTDRLKWGAATLGRFAERMFFYEGAFSLDAILAALRDGEHGPGLLVLDYLQMLRLADRGEPFSARQSAAHIYHMPVVVIFHALPPCVARQIAAIRPLCFWAIPGAAQVLYFVRRTKFYKGNLLAHKTYRRRIGRVSGRHKIFVCIPPQSALLLPVQLVASS